MLPSATFSTSKSSSDPTIKSLHKFLVSSDDLDVVTKLGASELQENVGFLSVLFQQDEFSKTLKEHGRYTGEDISTPKTVIRAGILLRTANLRSPDNCEETPSNDYEPAADMPSQVRTLPAARNNDRGSHGM
jgi:hypothetical protein